MTELISESMEHPLSLRRRASIRLHFLICKWCSRYKKQLRFIHNILGGNPEKVGENTPETLSREAQERIKQALRFRNK
ncbi:MAG: hypothetical protein MPW15_06830 [Candidatus Manganitrophus sp.]|nr:hypothetical protein [Candidatus Manganitrophus sp.]